jgi:hypothetical protein
MKLTLQQQLWRLLRRWVFLEVLLPVSLVGVLFWPVTCVVWPLAHPFERVFASADLLPLGAMILFGLCSEIEHGVVFEWFQSAFLECLRDIAAWAGGLCFLVYGFCRAKYMQYPFPDAGQMVSNSMTWIAWFSVSVILVAVVYSFAVRLFMIKVRLEAAS